MTCVGRGSVSAYFFMPFQSLSSPLPMMTSTLPWGFRPRSLAMASATSPEAMGPLSSSTPRPYRRPFSTTGLKGARFHSCAGAGTTSPWNTRPRSGSPSPQDSSKTSLSPTVRKPKPCCLAHASRARPMAAISGLFAAGASLLTVLKRTSVWVRATTSSSAQAWT